MFGVAVRGIEFLHLEKFNFALGGNAARRSLWKPRGKNSNAPNSGLLHFL